MKFLVCYLCKLTNLFTAKAVRAFTIVMMKRLTDKPNLGCTSTQIAKTTGWPASISNKSGSTVLYLEWSGLCTIIAIFKVILNSLQLYRPYFNHHTPQYHTYFSHLESTELVWWGNAVTHWWTVFLFQWQSLGWVEVMVAIKSKGEMKEEGRQNG